MSAARVQPRMIHETKRQAPTNRPPKSTGESLFVCTPASKPYHHNVILDQNPHHTPFNEIDDTNTCFD